MKRNEREKKIIEKEDEIRIRKMQQILKEVFGDYDRF
jgi:hypothetical protein